MFNNYLKIAWRSLWKNKFYTLINISGLAVGLATAIMLLLWVQNELSYDKFNKAYSNIYHLSTHFKANGELVTWGGVPGPLAVFARSISGVKRIVRIGEESDQNLSDKSRNKIFDKNSISYVDNTFFLTFDFAFLKGNKTNPFPNNNTVILTESTAKKIFGKQDAMGKIVLFRKNGYTVTGILKDFPENSSIHYDAVFPMSLLAQQFTANGGNGSWKTIDEDLGNFNFNTFVQLQPGTSAQKIGKAFSAAYKKAKNGDTDAFFDLQNLADMHLTAADGNTSQLRMVQIFMLVVVLLLAIASINYVNLSTARSLIRAKEVSVRKIVGAGKWQLFLQFTTETILLFCCASVLAFGIIYLFMPVYNNISGKELAFDFSNINVWQVTGLAVLGTLVLSSIYPAILLSSFKPIEALKGKISTGLGVSSFRKILVVFQFAVSVILLIGTLIIGKQMSYVRTLNIGYDKSYVFTVPLTQELVEHVDAVKAELTGQPGIQDVSAADAYDLSDLDNYTGDIRWESKPENNNMVITRLSGDKDFIRLMRMKFVEGGGFSGSPADSAHYILNETAAQKMGLKRPYVGQQISLHEKKGTIVGVVKDFNFKPLKEKISPLIFFNFWNNRNILYVRTNARQARHAIAAVEKQYKKYGGDSPFSYSFLDKNFEAKYLSDQRAGTLFNVFAGIAIFISCLGLFGLTTYTAQVKFKEIGIRKVLGASVSGIVQLLSKDFLQLVFLSIVIATPVAWWGMNRWLETFAYRMTISVWIFVLAGASALLIAFFTISFQAVKAALANPVRSLRSE